MIDGERRLRAAKEAGLKEIDADIHIMTDEEAQDAQMISFEQDADIHPLEKAEALTKMLKSNTIDALARKIGKPLSYVEKLLKLQDLIEPAKKAFLANRFTLSHAIHVARLQPLDQERCLTFMLKTWQEYDGWHDYHNKKNPEVEDFKFQKKQEDAPTSCSVKDLIDFIQCRIYLDLGTAAFDKKDKELLPAAGSCIGDCQKRSGFNKELFNDITKADICSDPVCFGHKQAAFLEKLKKQMKTGKEKYVEITRDLRKPEGHPSAITERNFVYVKGKPCKFTRTGIFIDADSRGKTALVCSAKKECHQHFADAIKQRNSHASSDRQKPRESYEQQELKREARKAAAQKRFRQIAIEIVNRIPKVLTKNWEEKVSKLLAGEIAYDLKAMMPKDIKLTTTQKINLALLSDEFTLDINHEGNIHPDLYKAAKSLGIKYEKILQKISDEEKAEKKAAIKEPKEDSKKVTTKKAKKK